MRNDTLVELLWLEMQVSAMSGHILFFLFASFVGQGLHFCRGLKMLVHVMRREILSVCLKTKGRFAILYLKYFNFGRDYEHNAT